MRLVEEELQLLAVRKGRRKVTATREPWVTRQGRVGCGSGGTGVRVCLWSRSLMVVAGDAGNRVKRMDKY